MKNIFFLSLLFVFNSQAAETFDDKWLIRFTSDTTVMDADQILSDVGLRVTNVLAELQIHVAKPEEKFSIEKLQELKSNPRVLYAEPNYKVTMDAKPNDPKLGGNIIRVREAWDIATGSKEIVVAVSDTGIFWNHEDLANHIWKNAKEIPENGVDDDGNGYVDDVHGWNFFSNTNQSSDDNRHGTHVAGIIGAEGNNGKGVAGVNWSVTLMPVKFLSGAGSGSTEGGVQTVLYAVKNGARIINASWGGGDYSQAMFDALMFAHSKGVLFVSSAGNSGRDTDFEPHYPSCYKVPNVISVASSTSTISSSMQRWSNYGRRSVHVTATGLNIVSALNGQKKYGKLSGTSMASPAVAGIAALVLSMHPELNASDLRNAVLNGVRGKYLPVSTGGLVDAQAALKQFNGTPQVWPSQYSLDDRAPLQMTAYGFSGSVRWSIDRPEVATVSDSGLLKALKTGKVIVTATGANNQIAHTQEIQIYK